MEFIVAIAFLFLYYIRPQDWLPGMAGMNIVKPLIATWLAAIFSHRERPRPLPGLLSTPHDWLMLAYFVYCVAMSPDPTGCISGFIPLVAFYALTVQSLTTWPRILAYINWTNYMLSGVALIAVLSLIGIDFTGAIEKTVSMKGRLCIGTWMHDNPNALGHTVVLIIPLSYLLYCWKRSVTSRVLLFPPFVALSALCVYRTESKGSFLVGAICLIAAIIIGRPKIVKIGVVTVALTLGVSALSFLPRMGHMDELKNDQGVQGRLMAWEQARTVSKTLPTGRGWAQFRAYITWRGDVMPKATHSSYVQVAADLGMYGMFFYVALLWCCGRTLVSMRRYVTDNPEMERCRRCALIILIGYSASGWMINREYASEYFLLIALGAAMHRLVKVNEMDEQEQGQNAPQKVATLPHSVPNQHLIGYKTAKANTHFWNHFAMGDILACIGLTWLVFQTWDYLMTKI